MTPLQTGSPSNASEATSTPTLGIYLPVVLTRWEGTILYYYTPLIYARDEDFLYKITLHKDWDLAEVIPTPKKPQKLPIVLSPEVSPNKSLHGQLKCVSCVVYKLSRSNLLCFS